MQSSDLRRNLLQEVVQDHDRGLIGEVSHGYGGNLILFKIVSLKPLVKLESTKQA